MTGEAYGRAVLEGIRKRQCRELQENSVEDFAMICAIRELIKDNGDDWADEILAWFDDRMTGE
jgi:hypothetical protein